LLAKALKIKDRTVCFRWKKKGFIPHKHQVELLRQRKMTKKEIIKGRP
jgi:hypothetical protein